VESPRKMHDMSSNVIGLQTLVTFYKTFILIWR